MTHGSLKAVTLVSPSTSSLTNFSYDSSTEQFIQADTDLCLEYNASSSEYPVRMDTCTTGRVSQEWTNLGNDEEYNYYSGTCLEGSEVISFGSPLVMAPCSDEYNGQFWVFYGS